MSIAQWFASSACLLLFGQMVFFLIKGLQLGKTLIRLGRRRYGTAGLLVVLAVFYAGLLWSDQSGRAVFRRPFLQVSGGQAWALYLCLAALICLWASGMITALRRAAIRENGIVVAVNRMWGWDDIIRYEWDGSDLLLFVEMGSPFLRRISRRVLEVAPDERARVAKILEEKIPGKETAKPA